MSFQINVLKILEFYYVGYYANKINKSVHRTLKILSITMVAGPKKNWWIGPGPSIYLLFGDVLGHIGRSQK